MSSHHIVKDQQEPALFIEKAITGKDYEIISNLLEWSPIVIVTENSLDFALEWNIKVDVVLCTEEQLENIREKVLFQFPIQLISCTQPSSQNAFEYLLAKGHYALNIYHTNFDKEVLNVVKDFTNLLKIVFFDEEKSGFYCIDKWEKWLPQNRKIEVIGNADLVINGLIQEKDSQLFLVENEGLKSIETNEGIWVIES